MPSSAEPPEDLTSHRSIGREDEVRILTSVPRRHGPFRSFPSHPTTRRLPVC